MVGWQRTTMHTLAARGHLKWLQSYLKDTWYTLCQILVEFVNTQRIKNLNDIFFDRGSIWEKWIQSSKVSPGGRVEIENVTFCKFNIFNFSSTTRWLHFFHLKDPWSKKASFRFLIQRELIKISNKTQKITVFELHVYQVPLRPRWWYSAKKIYNICRIIKRP